MEELRRYIQEVIDAKGLSLLGIEKRCGGRIKDSYVKNILDGKTKTISVEKLNALAEGLGVDALELYKIASGKQAVFQHDDAWPSAVLHQVIGQIINSQDLTVIVKELVTFKPAKLKALRKQIKT